MDPMAIVVLAVSLAVVVYGFARYRKHAKDKQERPTRTDGGAGANPRGETPER